jgi:hypothetical protein
MKITFCLSLIEYKKPLANVLILILDYHSKKKYKKNKNELFRTAIHRKIFLVV